MCWGEVSVTHRCHSGNVVMRTNIIGERLSFSVSTLWALEVEVIVKLAW